MEFIFKHQVLSGAISGFIMFIVILVIWLMVLVARNKDNVISQKINPYFQKHIYQKRCFLVILIPFMFYLFLLDLTPDIWGIIKEDTKNSIYYFKRAWKNK